MRHIKKNRVAESPESRPKGQKSEKKSILLSPLACRQRRRPATTRPRQQTTFHEFQPYSCNLRRLEPVELALEARDDCLDCLVLFCLALAGRSFAPSSLLIYVIELCLLLSDRLLELLTTIEFARIEPHI